MGRLSLRASSQAAKAAYLVALLDFAASLAFMVVQGVANPDIYFQLGAGYDLAETVFDLNIIGIARGLVLPLLFWQGNDLGTMYRQGRDGDSKVQVLITRGLIIILPLASLAFAIFKAAIIRPDDATGAPGVVLASISCCIFFPVLEIALGYYCYVRVQQSGPDYNYLLEDTIYDEETPLLVRARSKSSTSLLPGLIGQLGETNVGPGTPSRGPVTTAQAPQPSAKSLSDRPTARTKRQAKKTRRDRKTSSADISVSMVGGPTPASDKPSWPVLPKVKPDETPDEKNYRQRCQIVAELVETEERYVETLAMIIRVFLLPLRDAAEIPRRGSLGGRAASRDGDGAAKDVVIEKQQLKTIFLEIETIYKVNSLLLEDLRSRFSEWGPDQKIADVFLAILSYFKTYTSFANNFDNAIGTIGICKQQRSFADFLLDCLHNPACRKMWLDDHLIVPIQRIPRYIMLMQSLLKKTKTTHPDHDDLCTALDKLETLATHINDSKRVAERSLMMIGIQRMVKRCPNIVAPTRAFINDFPCVEIAPISHDEHEQTAHLATSTKPTPLSTTRFAEVGSVVIYLFNDMLMIAAHELVSSMLGRTQEALKTLASPGGPNRPTTVSDSGQETMHKFKFQRLVMMDEVQVFDCSEDVENGFIIRFPRGSVYYESPSLEEKRFFLKTFTQVASEHRDNMRESGPVLHARRSLRAQQEKEARASTAMSSAVEESLTERETANETEGGTEGPSPPEDTPSRELTPTPFEDGANRGSYMSLASSVDCEIAPSNSGDHGDMQAITVQPESAVALEAHVVTQQPTAVPTAPPTDESDQPTAVPTAPPTDESDQPTAVPTTSLTRESDQPGV